MKPLAHGWIEVDPMIAGARFFKEASWFLG